MPALAGDQQHPRVPGRFGRHRAYGQRCVEPPADTKFDYDINRLIFEAIEKSGQCPTARRPNIAGDEPGAYHHDDRLDDWFQAHNEVSGFGDRYHGLQVGALGRTSASDFQENGWINAKVIEPDRWGTYRRFETGWMRMGKDACTAAPWSTDPETGQPVNNFGCPTPTGLVSFWSMEFETFCLDMANQFEPGKFDVMKEIMPNYEPPTSSAQGGQIDLEEYPIILTTGRRIPVYFHSRAPPAALVPRAVARAALGDEPRPTPRSSASSRATGPGSRPRGARCARCVDLYYGIAPGWANAEHAWWFPELPAPTHGC